MLNKFRRLMLMIMLVLQLAASLTLALSSSPQQCSKNRSQLRVLVLRHGQTDANAGGVIQGSSDMSRLTELGRQQAAQVAKHAFLAESNDSDGDNDSLMHLDSIYCSPLTRARETLQVLLQQNQQKWSSIAVKTLPNLREIDFYDWENQDKKVLQEKFPHSWKAWIQGGRPRDLVVYEKESIVHYPLLELWQRADQVWDEIFHQLDNDEDDEDSLNKTILIVAHGSLGQALLSTAMGWDATFFRRYEFPNCGMAELIWDSKGSSSNVGDGVEDAASSSSSSSSSPLARQRPRASKWRWRWPAESASTEWNTLETTQ